jgi:hypothetical protein
VPATPAGVDSSVEIACSVTCWLTFRSNITLVIGGGVFQP